MKARKAAQGFHEKTPGRRGGLPPNRNHQNSECSRAIRRPTWWQDDRKAETEMVSLASRCCVRGLKGGEGRDTLEIGFAGMVVSLRCLGEKQEHEELRRDVTCSGCEGLCDLQLFHLRVVFFKKENS